MTQPTAQPSQESGRLSRRLGKPDSGGREPGDRDVADRTHHATSSIRPNLHPQVAPHTAGSAKPVVIGAVWLAGAAFWFAAGFVHDDHGWRYDAAAGLWIVADLLILAGLIGLLRLRPHGDSRLGAAFLVGAIAGRLAFAGGEMTSIVQGNDDNILLPVGVMVTVASLAGYGLVVLRQRHWTGPGRFAVVVMAAYPLFAMMPIAAATGEPPPQLIAGWGIPTALVGLTCLTQHSQSRDRR